MAIIPIKLADARKVSFDLSVLYETACIITGDGQIYQPGSVLVERGRIADVGNSADLRTRHQDALIVDANAYVLIPGLINAHSHAPMGFFRGLGHEVGNGDPNTSMIERFLFPAERSLTAELIEPLSYSYLYAGLKSGTTCFADHYYFVDGVAQAMERLGLRGVVGETCADLGGAFPGHAAWHKWQKTIDMWPYSSRITPSIAPHAADTVSSSFLRELSTFARTRKLPLHMHLAQTRGEWQRVQQREGCSPVAYAERCGALSENTLAVHLLAVDADDVRILQSTGTSVGFCPASEILYENLPPLAEFIEADLPLALATDSAASNDDADMLSEMRLAALLLRDRSTKEMQPAEAALRMATKHGARVFGLENIAGCIKNGAAADLVFLRPDLANLPWQSPIHNLVFSINSRHVQHVMIDGHFVLFDGQTTRVSEADLTAHYLQAVQEIKRRISKRN